MKTLAQADKATVAAIHRLNAPEMKPLLMFFNNQFEESKTALIRADGDTFARLQGRAGYLQELLEAIETSSSVLAKLK